MQNLTYSFLIIAGRSWLLNHGIFLSSQVLGILRAPSPCGPFRGGGTLDASLRPGGGVWGGMGRDGLQTGLAAGRWRLGGLSLFRNPTHCRAVYGLMR